MDDFITEDFRASVQEVLDMALRGEETANFQLPLVTAHGSRVEILLNATSRKDAEGHIIGVVGIGQVKLVLGLELSDLLSNLRRVTDQ